jgi:2Fe-2S ferredoxin
MVKIIIENLGQKVVEATEPNKSVLQQFQAHFIDYLHECGGKGRCTTCKMRVTKGMENLTPLSGAEKKYRGEGLLMIDERLACQVGATGDIIIEVPKESQLPHLNYGK